MVNPSQLVDDIVNAVKTIPGVLALIDNNANNVIAYKRSHPTKVLLEMAIYEANPPAILVSHARTSFGRSIDHQFALYLKPKGSADELFMAIREGIPTAFGGVPFKRAQINTACLPPFISQYFPRPLIVSEGSFIDIHEITLSLVERGADT